VVRRRLFEQGLWELIASLLVKLPERLEYPPLLPRLRSCKTYHPSCQLIIGNRDSHFGWRKKGS
jgi:hypothetical protein